MIDLKLHRSTVRPLATLSAALVGCAALLGSASAFAQDPAAMTATATAGTATNAGGTDHAEAVASKLAFGWMGVNSIPIAQGAYAGNSTPGCGRVITPTDANIPCRPTLTGSTQVAAPTIGVRYWLNDGMGIDVGIGLGIYNGSTESYPYPNDNTSNEIKDKTDKLSVLAFALHAGVPIVLGTPGKHYTFEVIPEANLGIASGTQKDHITPPSNQPGAQNTGVVARDDLKLGGFRLDVGARIGSEIQFGFIGLPKLALQATVGLYFSTQSVKVTAGGKDVSDSNTTIGTSVQQAPWALFTNNIAALYYFLDPGRSRHRIGRRFPCSFDSR